MDLNLDLSASGVAFESRVFSDFSAGGGKLAAERKVNEWWCYLFGLVDWKITRHVANFVPSEQQTPTGSVCVCEKCKKPCVNDWFMHIIYLWHVCGKLCVCSRISAATCKLYERTSCTLKWLKKRRVFIFLYTVDEI